MEDVPIDLAASILSRLIDFDKVRRVTAPPEDNQYYGDAFTSHVEMAYYGAINSLDGVFDNAKYILDGSIKDVSAVKDLFILITGKPDMQKILLSKINLSALGAEDFVAVFSVLRDWEDAELRKYLYGKFENGSFIGTNSSGQGAVNDVISHYFDAAVASGIDNWSDAERYVMERIDKNIGKDGEVRRVVQDVYYGPYADEKMNLFEAGHHKTYRFPNRNIIFSIIDNYLAVRRRVEGGGE